MKGVLLSRVSTMVRKFLTVQSRSLLMCFQVSQEEEGLQRLQVSCPTTEQ